MFMPQLPEVEKMTQMGYPSARAKSTRRMKMQKVAGLLLLLICAVLLTGCPSSNDVEAAEQLYPNLEEGMRYYFYFIADERRSGIVSYQGPGSWVQIHLANTGREEWVNLDNVINIRGPYEPSR